MTIPVGSIARGEDFFDREREREQLWDALEGNHIVISGPRRLGKSSVLERMKEDAEGKGFIAELIDVEGIDNPRDFIHEISHMFPEASVSALMKKLGGKIGSLSKVVRKVTVSPPDGVPFGLELQAMPEMPWQEKAQALQHRLSAHPMLILIDEFSVFLEKSLKRDREGTDRLLGWLRAWRQQSVACRFIFSGSIGLNSLLDRYRLATSFNDCFELTLGPFRLNKAFQMLTDFADRKGWAIDEEARHYLCKRIGWLSPFYLNLMLLESIAAAQDRLEETGGRERDILKDDIDGAFDRLITCRSRFIHWYRRLERDLPEPQRACAMTTLGTVATSEDGCLREQLMARLNALESDPDRRAMLLDEVLLVLEEDGYLAIGEERIQFPSFLLRDYWRRNHAR